MTSGHAPMVLSADHTPMPTTGRRLLPGHLAALRDLESLCDTPGATLLQGVIGSGKTTLLRALQQARGGLWLDFEQVLTHAEYQSHVGFEEVFMRLVEEGLRRHRMVLIDDIDTLYSLEFMPGYVRAGSLQLLLRGCFDLAVSVGRRIVMSASTLPEETQIVMPAFAGRAELVSLPALGAADYEALMRQRLGDAPGFDSDWLHKRSSGLNLHQLALLVQRLHVSGRRDEGFIEHVIGSELEVQLAEPVTDAAADNGFDGLVGMDRIVEALQTHLLNAFRFDRRLMALGLKPQRGVLLYGPAGSGKTHLCQAIERKLPGKVFRIDGSLVDEPPRQFYFRLFNLLQAAASAAPSVLLIEDADLLFSSGFAPGFERTFLTQLDGLASRTAGRVSFILTAQRPGLLPAALLRSGRVELWLRTELPDAPMRLAMLKTGLQGLPATLGQPDPQQTAALLEGFSAVDVRRVAADAKALYASDVLAGRAASSLREYLAQAVQAARHTRHLQDQAERRVLDMAASD